MRLAKELKGFLDSQLVQSSDPEWVGAAASMIVLIREDDGTTRACRIEIRST